VQLWGAHPSILADPGCESSLGVGSWEVVRVWNLVELIQRALAALLVSLGAGPPAAPADPLLCHLQDRRITESSGVAVSPGVIWTHNDSGDGARFFALDRSCRTLATYTVAGGRATDWEDMARGAGALWFGDIGDNDAERSGVVVYRVPEPSARPAVQSVRATAYRFRYDDGPHDAEALLVEPRTGQVFVVTKSFLGKASVYAGPLAPSASSTNVLTKVGSFRLSPSGTAGGPAGVAGQVSVTGGDISPRGDRIVVRTYTDAYEWVVTGGDVAAAFEGEPVRTELPETEQGEAIAYDTDGRSWVTTSEGTGAPVHRIARGGTS
jgi:hypothetical protein